MPGSVFLADPDTGVKLGTTANPLVIAGTAASGAQAVAGDVASGAADSGNPVKVGAVFNTTAPTVTNGQRSDLQADATGAVSVAPKTATSAIADAASNTIRTLSDRAGNIMSLGAYPLVYNGTTWDRQRVGDYQLAQTAITAASGNVANASAAATLAANATKTTYITGFEVTASGSTAALVVTVTVAGVITGTMSYTFVFPAGVTTQAASLIVPLPKPIPGSAVNTAIVVTCPAGGAGNTNTTVVAHGYQQ